MREKKDKDAARMSLARTVRVRGIVLSVTAKAEASEGSEPKVQKDMTIFLDAAKRGILEADRIYGGQATVEEAVKKEPKAPADPMAGIEKARAKMAAENGGEPKKRGRKKKETAGPDSDEPADDGHPDVEEPKV